MSAIPPGIRIRRKSWSACWGSSRCSSTDRQMTMSSDSLATVRTHLGVTLEIIGEVHIDEQQLLDARQYPPREGGLVAAAEVRNPLLVEDGAPLDRPRAQPDTEAIDR
jgi:hypothetical protein